MDRLLRLTAEDHLPQPTVPQVEEDAIAHLPLEEDLPLSAIMEEGADKDPEAATTTTIAHVPIRGRGLDHRGGRDRRRIRPGHALYHGEAEEEEEEVEEATAVVEIAILLCHRREGDMEMVAEVEGGAVRVIQVIRAIAVAGVEAELVGMGGEDEYLNSKDR